MRRIIFHIPNKIDINLASGSQIRPIRMLESFKNIGYEVDVVMGYVKERKVQIKNIKNNIKKGVKYDFLYSESSTMPTALTEQNHLPIAPFLDFNFFRFCKKNKIKIGLFYRDIHWRFEQYEIGFFDIKKRLALFFYKFDLRYYSKYIDVLYLPSIKMLKYVPINFSKKVSGLPPGLVTKKRTSLFVDSLSFIYVGGLGIVYDLDLFIKVVTKNNLSINLCTRKKDWDQSGYKEANFAGVNVSHLKGDELFELYNKSSIGVLFVKPVKYWEFAIAVKLFEYISYRKPVITVKGTAVGSFVEKNNIGWAIEHTEKALEKLLSKLKSTPEIIQEKILNIEKIIPKNTWEARAKQVQKDLES